MLGITHLLHLLSDIVLKMEEEAEYLHFKRVNDILDNVLQQTFVSEEEAARAYDQLVMTKYSKARAILNFHYPSIDENDDGQPLERYSTYRGVKYVNHLKRWKIDASYI